MPFSTDGISGSRLAIVAICNTGYYCKPEIACRESQLPSIIMTQRSSGTSFYMSRK